MRKMLEATDLPVQMASASAAEEEEVRPPWWLADDALWNPFEVAASVAGIMFWFAFLLGRRNYEFAVGLFMPVLWACGAMLIWQAIARHRSGFPGVLNVMWRGLG